MGDNAGANRLYIMLAASVDAVEDLTTGRKETATVVRHLVDPTGKTGIFWDFYKLYDPTHVSCLFFSKPIILC